MSTSRAKKENIIILPNKDKLPTGKIKDVGKIMNIVSAEYGIEDDLGYFTVIKNKCINVFMLQYMPRSVRELHTINSKKFVLYDLIRNGYDCVIKTDDELSKRAVVINDLLNTIDDTCKETINSKLSAMLDDIPGQLEDLLDQLLTDPQFNSFKFRILDASRTSRLLCVNGDGLFLRCTEPPYDIIKQLPWQDIVSIKVKSNKLIFRKKNGEIEDILCSNKKIASEAQDHLSRYLAFVCNRESGDSKPTKSGWLRGLSLRLRQSFNKRARSHDTGAGPSVHHHTPLGKSMSAHHREKDPPNSTVPESSVISDDCMDNLGSMVEPSIKTNSTHEVSLESDNSFRNCPLTLDQNQQSTVRHSSGQDDHMSVKTTSTYEVSFESNQSPRTVSFGSKSDPNYSPGQGLTSFGQAQQKKTPPLSQIKTNTVFSKLDSSDEGMPPPAETFKPKIVAMPPPKVPTRVCEIQTSFQGEIHYPRFDDVKLPPPPPVRSQDLDLHVSLVQNTISPMHQSPVHIDSSPPLTMPDDQPSVKTDDINQNITVNTPPAIITTTPNIQPATDNLGKNNIELNISAKEIKTEPITIDSMENESYTGGIVTVECINDSSIKKVEEYSEFLPINNSPVLSSEVPVITSIICAEVPQEQHPVIEESLVIGSDLSSSAIQVCTPEDDNSNSVACEVGEVLPIEVPKSPTKEEEEVVPEKETVKPVKVEYKLPVYHRKSIPSPKVQRPNRIPSIPNENEQATAATAAVALNLKLPSPSDKENYNSTPVKNESSRKCSDTDNSHANQNVNFSRFGNEECKLDSKTTITTMSTAGDNITKKTTKTEISSTKTSGIQAPKQYKTTTTITSTVKKPADAPKSPVLGVPRTSGIPRMSSKP